MENHDEQQAHSQSPLVSNFQNKSNTTQKISKKKKILIQLTVFIATLILLVAVFIGLLYLAKNIFLGKVSLTIVPWIYLGTYLLAMTIVGVIFFIVIKRFKIPI